MAGDDKLFTVDEAAAWLQVNEATIRRWIKRGELPAANLGKKAGYRIAGSDLMSFFNERREAVKAAMQAPPPGDDDDEGGEDR